MHFADLQSFIAHLSSIDDLEKIQAEVDPFLEISAIIDRYSKTSTKLHALLFENVHGSRLPLAANLFGTAQRIALALGVPDLDLLSRRLSVDLSLCKARHSSQALQQLMPDDLIDTVASNKASCFAVNAIEQGLDALPALQSWPGDGGRYLTLAQVFTRHPDSEVQNCGMYRLQILDQSTALLRCHPGSGAGGHLSAWHARGNAMPITLVLGGPPALTLCAGLPLPEAVSETDFASYLSKKTLTMTQSQTNDLCVPATAEIVIEGLIHPGETQAEGPFGNHTGYYSPASSAPVFRVLSLRMREGAVYPCTVVGPPPTENLSLAKASERLLLPLLQYDHPWVVDVRMPLPGIYHRAALVSVKGAELTAADISQALWASLLLRNSRLIVLLDEESDPRHYENAYWRVINADSWQNSLLIDGDKLIIDARNLAKRQKIYPDHATLRNIIGRWSEFGLGKS